MTGSACALAQGRGAANVPQVQSLDLVSEAISEFSPLTAEQNL